MYAFWLETIFSQLMCSPRSPALCGVYTALKKRKLAAKVPLQLWRGDIISLCTLKGLNFQIEIALNEILNSLASFKTEGNTVGIFVHRTLMLQILL